MASPAASPLVLEPLREQVCDHLRLLMARGELRPGGDLDLDALGARLGATRCTTAPASARRCS